MEVGTSFMSDLKNGYGFETYCFPHRLVIFHQNHSDWIFNATLEHYEFP